MCSNQHGVIRGNCFLSHSQSCVLKPDPHPQWESHLLKTVLGVVKYLVVTHERNLSFNTHVNNCFHTPKASKPFYFHFFHIVALCLCETRSSYTCFLYMHNHVHSLSILSPTLCLKQKIPGRVPIPHIPVYLQVSLLHPK